MNISLTLPQGAVDLRVTATADATVGDLLDALVADGIVESSAAGTGRRPSVLVDGRPAPLDHGLAEVDCRDGARVEVVAAQDPRPAGADAVVRATSTFAAASGEGVRVAVAGGLDAGRWLPAAPGRHRIGRGADALLGHATTSERHATLDVEASGRVTLTDHGSRNGTWVDGRPVTRSTQLASGAMVRTGAVATRVEDVAADDAPRGDGTAFNRPPRPAAPRLPDPLEVPRDGGGAAGGDARLPLASVVGGLVMGAVMWRMTGTVMYAMLAFVTPILALFAAFGNKRRQRRDRRRATAEQRRALADFATAVESASVQVTQRLRAMHPDLAEVVRRATAPSIRLWERRPDHDDVHHLVVGHATRRWEPPLRRGNGEPSAEARQALEDHAWLRDAPVVAPGGVIGVVGDRTAALAVARGLLAQAVVHHGPADLEAVLVTPDPLSWDGAKWLPHLADPATGRPRCAGPAEGRGLLADLLGRRRPKADPRRAGRPDDAPTGPALLVVLDGVETCEGRDAPGRALLRGEAGTVLGIVVAPTVDRLPASCQTVVVLEGVDGACRVVRPGSGEVVPGVLASGISEPTLAAVGRALARFDDPEASGGRDLPGTAPLPDLFGDLGAAPDTVEAVRGLWRRQRIDGRLRAPLGMTAHGPLLVDLNADGPHALVAGTTGAGKSELLRSLVAGLAAAADPDHVAFVLIDYKGGAAFDRCADLPHVAGLVTDLDDDLAERALTCLQAELHRRETILRAQRVGDLDAYRRLAASAEEPLPDLVVVIDEFATMAAELPDFLDSLVGIAQRGRSLGVHLVLATQRPSGVVSEDIRANTNLRIALRVQDRQDSTDVIEDPAAATLTRDQPGRAFVRLGPGHLVGMQSALVTGRARGRRGPVAVAPFVLRADGDLAAVLGAAADEHGDDRSDLDALVAAVRGAFDAEGLRAPREPWPAPLPASLPLAELRSSLAAATVPSSVVPAALADEPAHQRQVPAGWDLDAGSLVLVGMLGSGTSTALTTLAMQATAAHEPADLHVYAIDAGRGDLAGLDALPHVGAVVRLGEEERLARLVTRLGDEVERRRATGWSGGRRIVVLVDDWEAIAATHEHGPAGGVFEQLTRIVVDGASVGVLAAVSVGRPGGMSSRVLASIGQRWIFRLPDDADGAVFGVGGVAGLPTGRCIDASTGRRQQVALPSDSIDAASQSSDVVRAPEDLPRPVEVLPTDVLADALAAVRPGATWALPVGLRGDTLEEAVLELHPGEHALVAGPARSGRTSSLATIAQRAVAAGVEVVVAGARATVLHDIAGVRSVEVDGLVGAITGATSPTLVLVDDADQVDLPGMDVAVKGAPDHVHVVVAARADAVRGAYGHWVRAVTRSRVGLLLQPDLDLDGDLLGVRLPRRSAAPAAVGRGFLAQAGQVVQCQSARPDGRLACTSEASAMVVGA